MNTDHLVNGLADQVQSSTGKLSIELINQMVSACSGVIEIFPDDFVIRVRSGTSLAGIQSDLKSAGLTLGYDPIWTGPLGPNPTLMDLINRNLPHGAPTSFRSWKDWVHGATFIDGRGIIRKSGCQVSKSVAGYDLHKFLVGAQGKLGIIAEVFLRVFPIALCPITNKEVDGTAEIWHVLPSQFELARRLVEGHISLAHQGRLTIWLTDSIAQLAPEGTIIQSPDGQVIHPKPDLTWLNRLRERFDPEERF